METQDFENIYRVEDACVSGDDYDFQQDFISDYYTDTRKKYLLERIVILEKKSAVRDSAGTWSSLMFLIAGGSMLFPQRIFSYILVGGFIKHCICLYKNLTTPKLSVLELQTLEAEIKRFPEIADDDKLYLIEKELAYEKFLLRLEGSSRSAAATTVKPF